MIKALVVRILSIEIIIYDFKISYFKICNTFDWKIETQQTGMQATLRLLIDLRRLRRLRSSVLYSNRIKYICIIRTRKPYCKESLLISLNPDLQKLKSFGLNIRKFIVQVREKSLRYTHNVTSISISIWGTVNRNSSLWCTKD